MVRESDLEPKDCWFDSQYPTGRKRVRCPWANTKPPISP